MPTALYVGAQSVYAAITATQVKAPSDKSLLFHVQYMRELLDRQVIEAIVWLDTRDMIADGLTKGAVSRDMIHHLMDGQAIVAHVAERLEHEDPSS